MTYVNPSETATLMYPSEMYAAAFAEDEVWSAAQRLVEAGAVDADFLRSDRLRTAADAASSAILQDVAPAVHEDTAEACPTVAETVAEVRARLAPAEGDVDGHAAIAGAVETLLNGEAIHPEGTTFSAAEVSGFAAEAAYAAMEVRFGLSHSYIIREAVGQHAVPELRLSTITRERSNHYRVEYTFGEQSTYHKVRVIAHNGSTYTDTPGGYAQTGTLNAAQIEAIVTDLSEGHVQHGRLWGTWKARADQARLERASSDEGLDAYTNLFYAGLDIISRAAASSEHAFAPKQASEFQKAGVDWAIDAPSDRGRVSVRAQDGRVRVVKEQVMTDVRNGKETNASRQTYTVGAAEATLDHDFSVGKKRNYRPDRPQHQLNTAEIQALVDELAGINPDHATVWQRSETDR